MTLCIPDPMVTTVPTATGRLAYANEGAVGVFRLSTDPLFLASITLQNVVAGSRYRITRQSNGAELVTGIVAGSGLVDVELTGVPVYTNPMQVHITIRNASGSPPYKPFDTQASMRREGASAFILQTED